MGTGPTLRAALHALRTRYGALRGERLTEELRVDFSEASEYMQQQHTEGLRLVRVVEARLARALTEPEWEALSQRIDRDGATSGNAELCGTSSAAPTIAGAALAVQGMVHAVHGRRLSPPQLRAVLSAPANGTPSGGPAVDRVGVTPDLRAISRLDQAAVQDR